MVCRAPLPDKSFLCWSSSRFSRVDPHSDANARNDGNTSLSQPQVVRSHLRPLQPHISRTGCRGLDVAGRSDHRRAAICGNELNTCRGWWIHVRIFLGRGRRQDRRASTQRNAVASVVEAEANLTERSHPSLGDRYRQFGYHACRRFPSPHLESSHRLRKMVADRVRHATTEVSRLLRRAHFVLAQTPTRA